MPDAVARHFGCKLGIIYLSCRSLKHILEEHGEDITKFDLLRLPAMIRDGTWIADASNRACVGYRPPDNFYTYFAGVKVVGGGYEPYLSTFYRGKRNQLASRAKRGNVLQQQK